MPTIGDGRGHWWERQLHVDVVDFCAPMGRALSITSRRMRPLLPERLDAISSQGFGLGLTPELAWALGRSLPHLIVFAIEGGRFHMNEPLSVSVAQIARQVAVTICDEMEE